MILRIYATTLEAVDTTETEGTAADTGSDTEGNPSEDTEAGQDTKKDDTDIYQDSRWSDYHMLGSIREQSGGLCNHAV